MALIKCRECGKEISDKAKTCPNCGYKLKSINKRTLILLGAGGAVICLAIGIFFGTNDLRTYMVAKRWYQDEQYERALNKFQKIPAYKDSKKWISKTQKQIKIKNDTTSPVIKLSSTNINVTINDDSFDITKWIDENISITDDISSELDYSINTEDFDINKQGTYEVIIKSVDEAGNIGEAAIQVNVKQKDSPAYIAFNNATNLSHNLLDKDSGGAYSFKGINISQDEVEWLESGAIYRSISQQLEGFYIFGKEFYGVWGKNLVKTVFGIDKPSNWEELKPRIDEIILYVTKNNPLPEILSKFENLECVDGTFDYIKGKFNFTITSLSKAAKDLGITNEMLGYILASLEEYAPETKFDGDTYTFYLEMYGGNQHSPIVYEDFYNTQGGIYDFDKEENAFDILKSINEEYYMFYCFSEDVDIYKGNVVTTKRNIQIGSSYNAVLYRYGEGNKKEFNPDTDILYNGLITLEEYANLGRTMPDTCKYSMSYSYENAELVFLFDEDDQVSWIVYDNFIQ